MTKEKDYMGTANPGFTTYARDRAQLGTREANVQWWKEKRHQYNAQWFAVANTGDPRPDEESLSLFSAVFVSGLRHFAFADRSTRDAFVRQWASAREVGDPVT